MQRPKDPQLEGDPDPVMDALRVLVEEIEAASWYNQNGRLLELSPAFVEARELIRGYAAIP